MGLEPPEGNLSQGRRPLNGLYPQRLRPFEQFAARIERHWDGIVAYCDPRTKVQLGVVEGLNNKIRVIQRRADGYRDEEYMRLKILTAFLPRK
jgi:transposase